MSVRLCKRCKEMADKIGVLEKVLQLCHHRCWLCPHGKDECGSVNGKTQAQLRDEIFQQAVLEMIAEKRPERMN